MCVIVCGHASLYNNINNKYFYPWDLEVELVDKHSYLYLGLKLP